MRLFLKGDTKAKTPGEVNEYAGVEIEWIRGKRAVLTIFEDGVQKEDVKLYDMKTRDEMHKMMQSKGFTKRSAAEKLESMQAERREQQIQKLEQSQKGQSFFGNVMIVYGMVLVAVFGT